MQRVGGASAGTPDRVPCLLGVPAVEKNGLLLQYAADELRADAEVVFAAVQQNGWALLHGSEELRSDRDIVLAAVQQNGRALQHAESMKSLSRLRSSNSSNRSESGFSTAMLRMLLWSSKSTLGTLTSSMQGRAAAPALYDLSSKSAVAC